MIKFFWNTHNQTKADSQDKKIIEKRDRDYVWGIYHKKNSHVWIGEILNKGDSIQQSKALIPLPKSNLKIEKEENIEENVLSLYGKDLTGAAEKGLLDPVIGRDTEVQRVVQILGRRTKNNPVLLGEAGVSKTAIAEGLALHVNKRVKL